MANGIRKYPRKDANGEVYYRWGYDFYDDNGNRQRVTSCKTQGEAKKEYQNAFKRLGKGDKVKENKTLIFKDLCDDFLEYHAKVRCKDTTYDWYKKYIYNHLLPFFEDYRAININTELINKFLAFKKAEEKEKIIKDKDGNITEIKKIKLSITTVNHCLVTLKAVLNHAVKNEKLSKNPAANISKLKKEEKIEIIIPTKDEFSAMLNTAKEKDLNFYDMLFMAAFTGMREGEILGLCYDKIDFKNSKIYVHRSVYEGKLRNYAKTSSSYRTVDMIDSVAERLKIEVLL